MLNNRKSLMLLVSLLSFSWAALGQSAPNECSGFKQTPTEALIQHDEPLCRLGRAPSCVRIPKFDADTIFIGKVIRLEKVDGFEMIRGECSRVSVDLATLRVKESFTDPLPDTVMIHAGTVNGYWFDRNETALVFAHRNQDGTFSVSGCGGTESLTDWGAHGHPRENPIAKEDIAYLRARSKMPPTARILGNVWLEPPDTGRMVPGAIGFSDQTVTVSGPLSAQIKTSNFGEFHLDDLPPGKYVVRLNTSKKVRSLQEETVEITAKSCAQVEFYVESADDYRNVMKSLFRNATTGKP